ncbi:MAG: hypothetical protein WC718_18590, partial [Phycisphaerales bacterium]
MEAAPPNKSAQPAASPAAPAQKEHRQIAQIPQIKAAPPAAQPRAPGPAPANPPVAQPAAVAPQSPAPNPQSPSKLPVPDAKALEEGVKIAREAYQADYARAETPLARRELAKKILQQALENKEDPVARFVLLRLARDIAVHAEDTGLASEAIDRLAEGFEVDAWPMKAEIVANLAKQARKTAEHKAATEQALALMRQAVDADACGLALEMAKLALSEGGKARDKGLVAQARAGQKQAQQALKGLEEVEAARATLKDNADDPAANLTVGRYECFTKGDWAKGLAHLAKGRDATLAALAKEDLKVGWAERSESHQSTQSAPLAADGGTRGTRPTLQEADDAARLKLADAWWDLTQKAESREKEAMLLRAGYWYQQLGEIEQTLVRTKVENRLEQIAKLGRAIPGAPAKKTLTNSIGMQFVLIPAGEFLMGSTPEQIARAAEEGKKRKESQWYFGRI